MEGRNTSFRHELSNASSSGDEVGVNVASVFAKDRLLLNCLAWSRDRRMCKESALRVFLQLRQT